MGKQIKSLVCISSIVIPCKEQLKSSSALLKTIHHETPTNAPRPPRRVMMEIHVDQERPPAIQKTTLGYFSKNLKKREYARGTFFLQSEMIS